MSVRNNNFVRGTKHFQIAQSPSLTWYFCERYQARFSKNISLAIFRCAVHSSSTWYFVDVIIGYVQYRSLYATITLYGDRAFSNCPSSTWYFCERYYARFKQVHMSCNFQMRFSFFNLVFFCGHYYRLCTV
jgi:hypothetical protein